MGSKHKKIWGVEWASLTPKRVWSLLGLDMLTVLMMLKGGLPPMIAIAIHQSNAVANLTENYGFFAPIIAVHSQCLMPRAKFMKIMLFNLLATCVAASLCCLGIYCTVKAREHTTPAGSSSDIVTGYNSSASAVAAIWFIFDIWIGNTLRNYRPAELQAPMVAFSIYVAALMTRAGQIVKLADGLRIVKQLLLAFLIGFAIGTGTSLLVLPVTSRSILFHSLKPYPKTVKALLDAQIAYVRRSRRDGPWRLTRLATLTRRGTAVSILSRQATAVRHGNPSPPDPKAQALKTAINELNAIHSKARADLYYAKQEVAWGKLTAEDLEATFTYLRSILIGLSGIGMLPEIFRKLSKTEDNPHPEGGDESWSHSSDIEDENDDGYAGVHFIGPLCERLETATKIVNSGLQHALITLEFVKAKEFVKEVRGRRFSLSPRDEEETVDITAPGREGFTNHFQTKLQDFFDKKRQLPETWASLNAFSSIGGSQGYTAQAPEDREIRKEFFVLILIDHLQELVLQTTFDFVRFANGKVADGTMKSRRLIFPKKEAFMEWFAFNTETDDDEADNIGKTKHEPVQDSPLQGGNPLKVVGMGDPEHLPPANGWQRFGNRIRHLSSLLSSEQSTFGFRVAIASFSPAILAFLRQTQSIFNSHRWNWAVIAIILAMSPTSGKSLFGLVGRIAATTVSVVLCFVVWYIVVGKTVGVIVFLYIGNCLQHYFLIKYPRFIPTFLIALITFNMIIGYQLQNRKLGEERVTRTGLKNYPIYIFGPYRLAAVITGCALAFFWVIFPYPVSASSQVRRYLGQSLFVLANFYSCMHTTIEVWIHQEQGDTTNPQSPARLLERARVKLYAKEISLLSNIRSHIEFTAYEPSIGGRFPKEIYDNITSEIQTILTSMELMSHATRDLGGLTERSSSTTTEAKYRRRSSTGSHSGDEERWIDMLARAANSPDFHSQITTSVLCHLSAAVSNGLALPPYLSPPHPFPLAKKLRRMNEGSMDISNIEDPTFSAFVSIEVLSSMVSSSLKNLVSNVKQLVGELNFDIYIQPHRAKARERTIDHRNSHAGEKRRESSNSEDENEQSAER
ncbi:hypothetical protein FQN53_004553 [Emmonsiellopsis sp. PD_33]|nr:hypothetical protein FQN53_004553 [Emmonsiellopsis sp. PD_33]